MPSFQISLTRHDRAAGRFIAAVRRALQRALVEEQERRGVTQASIAAALGVNRSVIHRQLMGTENLTLSQVARIAEELGRTPEFSLPANEPTGNNLVGFDIRAQNPQQIPTGRSGVLDSIPIPA